MKLLLVLSVLMIAAGAFAQPVLTATASLTAATNIPSAGSYYFRNDAASAMPPGSPGENILWDFSGLVKGNTTPYDYRLCSAFTNCNSFPGTNLVLLEQHPNYTTMNYYISDSARLSLKGTANSNPGGYAAVYSDPEDFLRFPFTYTNSYTDSFACSSSPPYGNQYGTIQVTADGYGTLQLPQGSFYNVMRIKREEHFVSPAGISHILSYAWYDTALSEYLLIYKSGTLYGAGIAPSMSYTNQMPLGLAETRNAAPNLQLAPNPVSGNLQLIFELPVMTDLQIMLTDITGRAVMDLGRFMGHIGHQERNIRTDGLSNGVYFVRLQAGGQTTVRKITVQH